MASGGRNILYRNAYNHVRGATTKFEHRSSYRLFHSRVQQYYRQRDGRILSSDLSRRSGADVITNGAVF